MLYYYYFLVAISATVLSGCFVAVVQLDFVTPQIAACQAPVLHCLPEFAQIHVHRGGNAIQPSHPLLHPSPFPFNLSQHQGLFQ